MRVMNETFSRSLLPESGVWRDGGDDARQEEVGGRRGREGGFSEPIVIISIIIITQLERPLGKGSLVLPQYKFVYRHFLFLQTTKNITSFH